MRDVKGDLTRIRDTLRRYIRVQGFTQMEVQEALGWGRSYISQMLGAQVPIRVEQVLQILKIIDVKPEVFFGEVYGFGPRYEPGFPRLAPPFGLAGEVESRLRAQFATLRKLLGGLVGALERKSLISVAELHRAAGRFRRTSAGDGR
jgi:transcriptional regulator with XRE-family HTH domain